MKKMKRRGFAKVEFLATRDEAFALREAGHTLAMIYEKLSKCGKVTMSYKQFCTYMRDKPKPKASAPEATPRQRFGNSGNTHQQPEASDAFVHDPSAKGLMGRLGPAGGKKEN